MNTSSFNTIADWAEAHQEKLTKLHLGCGSKYLNGWCNIDANPSKDTDTHRGALRTAPDIWCDIKNLPATNESVDIIYTSHVVEHFYRHSAIELFMEFWRVLKPNGVIITEMPDLARILLLLKLLPTLPKYPAAMRANRDMIKAQLYGASWEANDEGYPYHKYVWERAEFCEMLLGIGFKILLQTGATQSHVPFRDMAVICVKPIDSSAGPKSNATLDDVLSGYGGKIFRAKKQLRSLVNLVKLSFIP